MKKLLKEMFALTDRHLLEDPEPERFLAKLSIDPLFREFPFSMLYELKNTRQSPVYHPEGSVWNHTLLTVGAAAKRRGESCDKRSFMWAALLHDIGKPDTFEEKNGRIRAIGHDTVGAGLARRFLAEFTDDAGFIGRVSHLVKYHMQTLYVSKRRDLLDIRGATENCDIQELALLSLCDRLGRLGVSREQEEEKVSAFLEMALSASTAQGMELGERRENEWQRRA